MVEKKKTRDVLGRLQFDVPALPRVQEQVLVVGRLFEKRRADVVALLPRAAQPVEAAEPLRQARGLAVLARPRDRVADIREWDGGREGVECGLLVGLHMSHVIVS